jgi:hypothetical protein
MKNRRATSSAVFLAQQFSKADSRRDAETQRKQKKNGFEEVKKLGRIPRQPKAARGHIAQRGRGS